MKSIIPLLLLAVLSPFGVAQTTVLDEGFDSGVPPTGWSEDNNGNSSGWTASGGKAYHDDYYGWNDNWLTTPSLDFSTLSNMQLDCIQDQTYPSWRDKNTIEASTNGGTSWTVVYDETGSNSLSDEPLTASLGAYDGLAGIIVSYRYQGDYANEWAIDDVLIGESGSGGGGGSISYEVYNAVAGNVALFEINGATAGAMVTMGVSFAGPGPLNSPYGQIDLSRPIRFLPILPVDSGGDLRNFVMVPPHLAGVSFWTQALVEEPSGPVLTQSHAMVIQ